MLKTDSSPKKILVGDDDPAFCALSREICAGIGYEVWTAPSGQRTLTMAQDKPDLILLDLMMSDVSGFDVLKSLKSNEATRAIPVLVCSASRAPEDMGRCASLGAAGYLPKPFKPSELVGKIRAVMG